MMLVRSYRYGLFSQLYSGSTNGRVCKFNTRPGQLYHVASRIGTRVAEWGHIFHLNFTTINADLFLFHSFQCLELEMPRQFPLSRIGREPHYIPSIPVERDETL